MFQRNHIYIHIYQLYILNISIIHTNTYTVIYRRVFIYVNNKLLMVILFYL